MDAHPPAVISASRRTDIPSLYMPWFMTQLENGVVETVNPYNRHRKKVAATPDAVHSIVFWSKNYGPFLKRGYGEKLLANGYRLFFHFTINSCADSLESGIPNLAQRLDQAAELCRRFGPENITWRFDPILFYRWEGESKTLHNLADFSDIAAGMAEIGVGRCITSFADAYQKAVRRMAKVGLSMVEPQDDKKESILTRMAERLKPLNITLSVCCEKALLDQMGAQTEILPAACIDHTLLQKLFGGDLSFELDRGQRQKAGCQCHRAIDIGDYSNHPCYHHCLYCYANPVEASVQQKGGKSE